MVKVILFPVLTCFAGVTTNAQDASSSNNFTKTAESNAVSYYYQFIDKQSRLYNGIDHLGYSSRIKGHAYFEVNTMQNGTVVYDGLLFKDVPMLYDLNKDQLIILHFNKLMKMGLINEKVKEFTINNHHYIRMVKDSVNNQPLETGFYDEIYNGKSSVLVKRIKFVEETVTDKLEQEFIARSSYYIRRDGTYKAVKSYKGLLFLLRDKSKEVRRYLKKNRIKYRKNRELAIAKAAAYYDTPIN